MKRHWSDLIPLFYTKNKKGALLCHSSLPELLRQKGEVPSISLPTLKRQAFTPPRDQASVPYSASTFFKGVYRLKPGYRVVAKKGRLIQQPCDSFNRKAPLIEYVSSEAYFVRFEQLLLEAVEASIKGKTQVALELSGGIDSSCILIALKELGVQPELYHHGLAPGRPEGEYAEQKHAFALARYLGFKPPRVVGAEGFDFLDAAKVCAKATAGDSPYLFFVFAQNLYRHIPPGTTLLSGYGGDECASNIVPLSASGIEWYRRYGKERYLCELAHYFKNGPSAFVRWKYRLPSLGIPAHIAKQFFKSCINRPHRPFPPYAYYQDYEWDLLFGRRAQHLRARVEGSYAVAKRYGLEYAYPLLHPSLLEFCYRVPLHIKRHNGEGRFLMREYYRRQVKLPLPPPLKLQGRIFSAPLDRVMQELAQGSYQEAFRAVPFNSLISPKLNTNRELKAKLAGYMVHYFLENCI